jgi:hypothetical protein
MAARTFVMKFTGAIMAGPESRHPLVRSCAFPAARASPVSICASLCRRTHAHTRLHAPECKRPRPKATHTRFFCGASSGMASASRGARGVANGWLASRGARGVENGWPRGAPEVENGWPREAPEVETGWPREPAPARTVRCFSCRPSITSQHLRKSMQAHTCTHPLARAGRITLERHQGWPRGAPEVENGWPREAPEVENGWPERRQR